MAVENNTISAVEEGGSRTNPSVGLQSPVSGSGSKNPTAVMLKNQLNNNSSLNSPVANRGIVAVEDYKQDEEPVEEEIEDISDNYEEEDFD